MAKRKRLGIRFDFSYNTSTGAAIFFQNIIKALCILPDEKKPEVIVFVSPDAPVDDIRNIVYPFLKVLPIKYLPVWQRAINRLYRKISTGKRFNLFNAKTYQEEPLDGVLGLVIPSEDIAAKKQLIWIADLQMFHLPQNFTQKEIKISRALEDKTVKGGHDIVLCSQWVIDDFNSIFNGHHCTLHRMRFATIHPNFSHIDFNTLKAKYNIDRPYFIVSNQFWAHKNHLLVCKAINALKGIYPAIFCVITGNPKTSYAKGKEYLEEILNYIRHNQLDEQIRFLGLIPREEQLAFLQQSLAIIQPSFFESWNTTVEDAKCLKKFIILSNLEVHIEQIQENVYFFDPNKVEELIKHMTLFLAQTHAPFKDTGDYTQNVKEFAEAVTGMLGP